MQILFDTNIILDFLGKREPFSENANALIRLCDAGVITGCIAAHVIPDVFYILRKQYTVDVRRSILIDLCEILFVIGINSQTLISALQNEDFSDFEDCLQDECANAIGARYIVTRNPKDFLKSKVPTIDPTDLLKLFLSESD